MQWRKVGIWLVMLLIPLTACTRAWGDEGGVWRPPPAAYVGEISPTPSPIFTFEQGAVAASPTPDAPHPLPTPRTQSQAYIVQQGDTLAALAARFHVSVAALLDANDLDNPNVLTVGQTLVIPAPEPAAQAPAYKILPDAALVAGPASAAFDVAAFVAQQGGYLATYTEEVNGHLMSGAAMVARVARDYSVSPRVLLALLEFQSGWVTHTFSAEDAPPTNFPLGWDDPRRAGLWRQLHWAANELNRGYYLWRANAVSTFVLADGLLVTPNPTVNAGTAAMQYFFALLDDLPTWQSAVSADGFAATYRALFGSPFQFAVEPLVPPDLSQPPMQLPFEPGVVWYYTGGPHSAWGDGAAWAALDFAPSDLPPNGGCGVSRAWVVAVADGLVVRAEEGAVVQDLDGDGLEQTGWDVLYMHIAPEGRVTVGTYLHAGDRIGPPSCEGGLANATHLHIARKYNGEWISADRDLPWVLDGWVSSGAGRAYDGFLRRGEEVKEACQCREAKNALSR